MTEAPPKPPAFALEFRAPPELSESATSQVSRKAPSDVSGVHWHPKAKSAAARMSVSEDDVSAALTRPDDARPDTRDPQCTVFKRGRLTVVTGRDGRVIAVRRT